jgi:hypothetical protein
MAPQQPAEIDRRIRESFGVEPAAIRRIVDGAQAAAAGRRPRTWALRTAAAIVGVVALAVAVAWWPRAKVVPPPADLVVSGSLTDGVLVLTWPDGSTSILGADRSGERPPDGVGIVLIDGEGDRQ